MNSEQLFGLFRHLATAIGGVLVASGKDQLIAIGGLLLALGTAWSVKSNTFGKPVADGAGLNAIAVPASAPASPVTSQPPPVSTIAPAILFWLCILFGGVGLGSFLSGCASTSTITPAKIDTAAAVTQIAAKNLCVPVLQRNPTLEPALLSLATSIDDVFKKGELKPEDIAAFVAQLSAKYTNLQPNELLLITSLIQDSYTLYTQTTGKTVVITTDPNAAKILLAFKQGILDGISLYHAFKPTDALHVTPSGALGIQGTIAL